MSSKEGPSPTKIAQGIYTFNINKLKNNFLGEE